MSTKYPLPWMVQTKSQVAQKARKYSGYKEKILNISFPNFQGEKNNCFGGYEPKRNFFYDISFKKFKFTIKGIKLLTLFYYNKVLTSW